MAEKTLSPEEIWARSERRWAKMREQTAAARRADRIARGLSADPPATAAELKRFLTTTGDPGLTHAMVAAGETVLRQALDAALEAWAARASASEPRDAAAAGSPAGFVDLPQLAIDVYKAMLSKSIRVDRHGNRFKAAPGRPRSRKQ